MAHLTPQYHPDGTTTYTSSKNKNIPQYTGEDFNQKPDLCLSHSTTTNSVDQCPSSLASPTSQTSTFEESALTSALEGSSLLIAHMQEMMSSDEDDDADTGFYNN